MAIAQGRDSFDRQSAAPSEGPSKTGGGSFQNMRVRARRGDLRGSENRAKLDDSVVGGTAGSNYNAKRVQVGQDLLKKFAKNENTRNELPGDSNPKAKKVP